MHVFVAGGSGFVEYAVCKLLQERGHTWTAGPNKVSWSELMENGLPECDAVINLCGGNPFDPMKKWNEEFKDEIIKSIVEPNSNIAKLISDMKQPPKVFVSASAVAYYPPSRSAQYTEDDPAGTGYFSCLNADSEKAAMQAKSDKTRVAVVRIGSALGKDGGVMKEMKFKFQLGFGGVIGSGEQFFPWIHVDDIAGIFIHAIENDQVEGALNATAPGVTTNHDFTKAFAAALWRPSFFSLPEFIVKAMFGSERAVVFLEGYNVQPKRTLESGYTFKYTSLTDAINDIVL
ncbi:epimerase family protein SDR39U1-like isoform X1 [Antedon mediterranea]|uniref:epimerase family protein SDR39U1-like isoform X1 n=1 Tax=Antedon mediterranea TaxID=105859 RepID=UPI003AF482DC